MYELGLTSMVRVDVVVRVSDAVVVRELLHASGASGWTSVSVLSGFGHHGDHQGRLLFNEQAGQVMIVTVLPPERASAVVTGLQDLLARRPGVMFVSDTWVSRPGYFQAD